MVFPRRFSVVAGCFAAGFVRNSIGRMTLDQQPAPAVARQGRFENSMTRAQTGCIRAKMPPHYCSTLAQSIFAEWGLVKRILVAGCSE
jgi:hypothetical protein